MMGVLCMCLSKRIVNVTSLKGTKVPIRMRCPLSDLSVKNSCCCQSNYGTLGTTVLRYSLREKSLDLKLNLGSISLAAKLHKSLNVMKGKTFHGVTALQTRYVSGTL